MAEKFKVPTFVSNGGPTGGGNSIAHGSICFDKLNRQLYTYDGNDEWSLLNTPSYNFIVDFSTGGLTQRGAFVQDQGFVAQLTSLPLVIIAGHSVVTPQGLEISGIPIPPAVPEPFVYTTNIDLIVTNIESTERIELQWSTTTTFDGGVSPVQAWDISQTPTTYSTGSDLSWDTDASAVKSTSGGTFFATIHAQFG